MEFGGFRPEFWGRLGGLAGGFRAFGALGISALGDLCARVYVVTHLLSPLAMKRSSFSFGRITYAPKTLNPKP